MIEFDLMLLGDGQRFQQMCFRLARYEFPGAIPLARGTRSTWSRSGQAIHLASSVPRISPMAMRTGTVVRRRALFEEAVEIIERE